MPSCFPVTVKHVGISPPPPPFSVINVATALIFFFEQQFDFFFFFAFLLYCAFIFYLALLKPEQIFEMACEEAGHGEVEVCVLRTVKL